MRKRNIGKSAKIRLESDGWEDGSHRELIHTDIFRSQPEALKANSLDFPHDPPGMCAGGGASEDVFRS